MAPLNRYLVLVSQETVVNPGFPVGGGGMDLVGGRGLPRQLHFENFVHQNERIWTLRGMHWARPPRSANEKSHTFSSSHHFSRILGFSEIIF